MKNRLTLLMLVLLAVPAARVAVGAVQTVPFWSAELGAIDKKREHVKKFEADLITPAEVALWKRSASNAGYHYFGCAKTFALMGKGFAEATLTMMKPQQRP